MNIINALRIGSSLQNPTPYKWFGLACSLGGLALVSLSGLAAAWGWVDGSISLDDAILLVSLVLGPLFTVSAHSAIATTDKIGLLPRVDSTDAGLQPEPVSTDIDAAGGVTANDINRVRSSIEDAFGKFGDS